MDPISMDTATSPTKTRIPVPPARSVPLSAAPPQRATHRDIRVAATGMRTQTNAPPAAGGTTPAWARGDGWP
jgi:hypothetical protein